MGRDSDATGGPAGGGQDSGGSSSGGRGHATDSGGRFNVSSAREMSSRDREAAGRALGRGSLTGGDRSDAARSIAAYDAMQGLIDRTPIDMSPSAMRARALASRDAFGLVDPTQRAINAQIRSSMVGTPEYDRAVKDAATAAALNASIRMDRQNLATGRYAQAVATQHPGLTTSQYGPTQPRGINLSSYSDVTTALSDPNLSSMERSALMGQQARTNPEAAARSFNREYGTDISADDISSMAAQGVDFDALGQAAKAGVVNVGPGGTVEQSTMGTLAHAYAPVGLQLASIFGGPLAGMAMPGMYGQIASRALPALGMQNLGPMSMYGTLNNINQVSDWTARLGLRPATARTKVSSYSNPSSLYDRFMSAFGD